MLKTFKKVKTSGGYKMTHDEIWWVPTVTEIDAYKNIPHSVFFTNRTLG